MADRLGRWLAALGGAFGSGRPRLAPPAGTDPAGTDTGLRSSALAAARFSDKALRAMHLAVQHGCGQRVECGVVWVTAWWSTAAGRREELDVEPTAAHDRPDETEEAEEVTPEQDGQAASLR